MGNVCVYIVVTSEQLILRYNVCICMLAVFFLTVVFTLMLQQLPCSTVCICMLLIECSFAFALTLWQLPFLHPSSEILFTLMLQQLLFFFFYILSDSASVCPNVTAIPIKSSPFFLFISLSIIV